MEHTKLVTPSELEDFADRRDSEPIIPELISLLVSLSCPDLTMCRIPYADAVSLPGLDGVVQTESGFPRFVPKQTSAWEMGRGEDAQKKATGDYRKRKRKTPDDERAKTTFVFVTPRSRGWDYTRQARWLRKRQSDGWKDIKILDGVQICDWLREFPAVGKWLLQRIGLIKTTTGLRTPAEHWENLAMLSRKGEPPLPPKIFLSGREDACQKLDLLFQHKEQQLILAIESENDAEDLVAAFIQSVEDTKRRDYSGRCLLVSEPDAWSTFANLQIPHVLVAHPRLDLAESYEQLLMTARARGHSVVVPLVSVTSRGSEEVIQIVSPSRSALEDTLTGAGFSAERAAELARAGANSLSALKRFLLELGQVPPYASWESARLLAQAVLVGSWKGENPDDREAMEKLLGKSYGEWIEAVRGETLRPDAPLHQRNETWRVVSRAEAWGALGPRIADTDLDGFKRMALQVLGQRDSRFDVPKEERYRHDDRPSCSRTLRGALADSLALLSTRGVALTSISDGKAEHTARFVVRELLEKADWKLWASLNSEMPLLAEAAPEQFLDALERALIKPTESQFLEIFRQEGTGLEERNYLTGVLWGLETLAWSPRYLGRVTLILGDLAAIDPGGNWSNRPRASLVDIFLPWHLQTLADRQERRAALEALVREQSNIAWSVLTALLPRSHGATSGTRKPAWRPFIPRSWKQSTLKREYWERVDDYADMCIQIAAADVSKLASLVEHLPSLPEPAYTKVLEHLGSASITSSAETVRRPLWEAIKDLAFKHQRFASAQWALPSERVKELEQVARRLEPSSFDIAHLRLFAQQELGLYDGHGDYEGQRKRLDEQRQQAVRVILSNTGPKGVLDFAKKTDAPNKVGYAVGAVADAAVDSYFLPSCLSSDVASTEKFMVGFLVMRFWTQKFPWVDQQLASGWSVDEVLAFLLKLPCETGIWQRAKESLGERVAAYWHEVQFSPWGLEEDDLREATEKLVLHGQPAAAVDCLYVLAEKKAPLPIELASAALMGLLASEGGRQRFESHHIIEVVKALQQQESIDSAELVRIEWNLLPLLNRISGGEPKALEYRLASSAEFFGEIVGRVFRSDNEDHTIRNEPTEQERLIAQNAYRLLHGWRILPGSGKDGSFNGDDFTRWVNEAKARTKASGHYRIAMSQLGQVLAYAPPDSDGLWIHRSVAAALDGKDVPEMRNGFVTGLFNERGVHGFTRGAEENKIAEDYEEKAKALSDSGFHRVADALRSLADDYRRDAQRESRRDLFDER